MWTGSSEDYDSSNSFTESKESIPSAEDLTWKETLEVPLRMGPLRDTGEVPRQTDAGRIYRPLLIVEEKKLKLTQNILEKLSNKNYRKDVSSLPS
ncbi:unnamed protein product [Allacma fusca]|uniref:Uncharacterized protein n=1 Tax=Allacma fusca TaxID=39272 RepID=A0A8J2JJ75_9HEXA|nr:unnamed protein product [Allacma fusca]